jgi:hypothetical protein
VTELTRSCEDAIRGGYTGGDAAAESRFSAAMHACAGLVSLTVVPPGLPAQLQTALNGVAYILEVQVRAGHFACLPPARLSVRAAHCLQLQGVGVCVDVYGVELWGGADILWVWMPTRHNHRDSKGENFATVPPPPPGSCRRALPQHDACCNWGGGACAQWVVPACSLNPWSLAVPLLTTGPDSYGRRVCGWRQRRGPVGGCPTASALLQVACAESSRVVGVWRTPGAPLGASRGRHIDAKAPGSLSLLCVCFGFERVQACRLCRTLCGDARLRLIVAGHPRVLQAIVVCITG